MNDSLLELSDSGEFSRDSLLLESSYNSNFQILEDMGYNSNMIKKIYAFLKPVTLEQAINYMTEQDGIYYHNFFKDFKHNKKTCYICGALPQNHSDYIPEEFIEENNSEIIINEENEEKEIPLKNNDGFICSICGDSFEINSPEIIKYNKCGDTYCSHCWFSYLQSKIEEGFGSVKCMNYNCKENLSKEFIEMIIKDNKKLVEKFKKFEIKMEILNNPNKKFCPYKNCDSYGEKTSNEKYIKCKNGHQFCFVCLRNWHGKEECDKKEEDDFKVWKEGKIIKKCPNCHIYTEKNEGCNHMTCAECKYQWCWLCNGKYSYGHYTSGKCNGLQFYKPVNEEDIKRVLSQDPSKRRIINNNINWVNPNGRIPVRYINRRNINPDNPLQIFNGFPLFVKILYVIGYIFCSFEIAGIGCINYIDDLDIITDCILFPFMFMYLGIILFSFSFFLLIHIYVSILIMLPGIFYWPWFEKVWISWFIGIVQTGDLIY